MEGQARAGERDQDLGKAGLGRRAWADQTGPVTRAEQDEAKARAEQDLAKARAEPDEMAARAEQDVVAAMEVKPPRMAMVEKPSWSPHRTLGPPPKNTWGNPRAQESNPGA
jgi:hypothetical protein